MVIRKIVDKLMVSGKIPDTLGDKVRISRTLGQWHKSLGKWGTRLGSLGK